MKQIAENEKKMLQKTGVNYKLFRGSEVLMMGKKNEEEQGRKWM